MLRGQEGEADLARCEGDVGVGDARGEADRGRGEGVVWGDGDGEVPEAACENGSVVSVGGLFYLIYLFMWDRLLVLVLRWKRGVE